VIVLDTKNWTWVTEQLSEAANALADRLAGAQWERTGRRSDGAAFTVDTISRDMVRDANHHVSDMSGRP
jgi:hypothetical protein